MVFFWICFFSTVWVKGTVSHGSDATHSRDLWGVRWPQFWPSLRWVLYSFFFTPLDSIIGWNLMAFRIGLQVCIAAMAVAVSSNGVFAARSPTLASVSLRRLAQHNGFLLSIPSWLFLLKKPLKLSLFSQLVRGTALWIKPAEIGVQHAGCKSASKSTWTKLVSQRENFPVVSYLTFTVPSRPQGSVRPHLRSPFLCTVLLIGSLRYTMTTFDRPIDWVTWFFFRAGLLYSYQIIVFFLLRL